MKVNLELLKFHSINYSKKFNNLFFDQIKEKKKYNKIWNDFLTRINEIKKFEYKEFNGKKEFHCHEFNIEKKALIIKIIESCHKKLYKHIEQNFLEELTIETIDILQFSITKEKRIVCIFDKNKETLYPILFDLKHMLYNNKNINSNKERNKKWCFLNELDKIMENNSTWWGNKKTIKNNS